MVHGITSTPQMVRPVAERVAEEGYAVAAPLLPGRGTRWQDMARTRYADWLGAVVLAAEELRREHRTVVAFGVSLGGALVTDIAARRPGLFDGLVPVNPGVIATDRRLRVIPHRKHLVPVAQGTAAPSRRSGPPPRRACRWTPAK